MNKREMLHKLLDSVLDIEEVSCKVASFHYMGFVQSVSYDVSKNKKAWNEKLIGGNIYLNSDSPCFTITKEFNAHLDRISDLSSVEDGPVEEMVTVKITESKAKELGLIA